MTRKWTWMAAAFLAMPLVQGGEPAPEQPGAGKAPTLTTEERIVALEKQVQLLMQSMVEKDNRIADLQRKVDELSRQQPDAGMPGMPGMQFRGTQEELDRMLRNWRRDFFREDPNDANDFQIPWRRENPLGGGLTRSKPRLGVMLQEPSPDLADRYQNDVKTGAFVTQVVPGSAAQAAGIAVGDCITAFDERPVIEVSELIKAIQTAAPGKHVLTVKRRGEELKLNIQLGEVPGGLLDMPEHRIEDGWLKRGAGGVAGMREVMVIRSSSLEITPPLAQAMHLTNEQRGKMDAVLAKHLKQLSEEYSNQAGKGGGFTANDAVLKPMIDEHVAAAEKELQGVLDGDQINTWREYRMRNNRLSVSRSLEPERQTEPDGMNF